MNIEKYLTIIIPVYNGEKYIQTCVESIGEHEDVQCVFINDGSLDNSGKVLDELCGHNRASIEVVHIENNGVSNARNIGLKYAKGKWIMFLDIDDILLPDWYEIVKDKFESSKDMICFTHIWEYVPNKSKEVFFTSQNARKLVLTTSEMNTCWAKLYRRKILEKYNVMFNTSMKYGEDLCFVLDCCSVSNSIEICNKPILFYRNNPTSAMHNGNIRNRLCDNLTMLNKRLEAVQKQDGDIVSEIYGHHFAALTDIMRSVALSSKRNNINTYFRQIREQEYFNVVMENVDYKSLGVLKKFEFSLLKRLYIFAPLYFRYKAIIYKFIG